MAQTISGDSASSHQLMEPIYREADKIFQVVGVLAGILGCVIGLHHGFKIWALIPMVAWVLGLLAIQKLPRTANLALTGFWFTILVVLYLALSRGLVETRLMYPVVTAILIYYRNRILLIVVAVVAFVFILGMFQTLLNPDWALAAFFDSYMLESVGMTFKKILYTSVVLVINSAVTIWVAYRFEKRTLSALLLDRKQREQIKILNRNQHLAERMAEGHLEDTDLEQAGDALGQSLERMRVNLLQAHIREQEERFINEGIKGGDEVLRHQSNGLEALSDEVLQFIVEYLDANQGAIFLLEQDEEGEPWLEMYACYAYERKKHLHHRFKPGQGLSGQVFLEGKTSYLRKIPEGYVQIKSGLGNANPRNLVMVPMNTPEGPKGVLELATFHELSPYHIEFLEKLAVNMASTFEVVRTNDQTRELLAETRSNAEDLRTQEEEMRQNMEELEATQEEMRRKEREYLKQVEQLKASHTIEMISLKRELAEARDALQQAQKEEEEAQ